MAVVDHVASLPYADRSRMAAAGGSYGGYMVDWMLGHTQRFKALISHAGVYDLRSEFGGDRGAVVPDVGVQRHALGQSGIVRELVAELVREGVPHADAGDPRRAGFSCARTTQGLQLFTALQLQKVPSKLLLFPDEGHWILKPQNSLLWYKTFHRLDRFLDEKVKLLVALVVALIVGCWRCWRRCPQRRVIRWIRP